MHWNEHTIDAVIFDFGGVILNIDYTKTIDAFVALGVSDFENQYSQMTQSNLFDLLETGKIDSSEFYNLIRKNLNISSSNGSIQHAWNALLEDYRIESLSFLEQIKSRIPTYLLSNTNAIHQEKFESDLSNNTQYQSLHPLFQKVYYSHHIQMRKPHKETFLWVCEQNMLNPESTLFIDDSKQHLVGARKAGLKTHHLQPTETIEVLLRDFLA